MPPCVGSAAAKRSPSFCDYSGPIFVRPCAPATLPARRRCQRRVIDDGTRPASGAPFIVLTGLPQRCRQQRCPEEADELNCKRLKAEEGSYRKVLLGRSLATLVTTIQGMSEARPAGVELTCFSNGESANSKKSGAGGGATDGRLASIVEKWPTLSDEAKRQILDIVGRG